jgi:hypothetical protein
VSAKAAKNRHGLHAVKDDAPEGTKKRPLRSNVLPDAPGKTRATFEYALDRDGPISRHLQVILDIQRQLDTDAYDNVWAPALAKGEARRIAPRLNEKGKRNVPGPYPVHELWLIDAAHKSMGHLTYLENHEWLVSDYARPFLKRFGFDHERPNRAGGRRPKLTPGIPSLHDGALPQRLDARR